MKVEKVVKQETLYIGVCGLIFSILMQAVFLIGHWWNWSVLWGNLLGFGISWLNFFLMALTVQIAVAHSAEDAIKKKFSQEIPKPSKLPQSTDQFHQ